MDVSLDQFIKLSLEEKANFVWQSGIFLDNFVDREKTTNLYYSRNFYIEITVAHREGKILEITGFKGERRLDKYLRKIVLHELI
jgi:hypothetical protein